jgi:hypothetical protein
VEKNGWLSPVLPIPLYPDYSLNTLPSHIESASAKFHLIWITLQSDESPFFSLGKPKHQPDCTVSPC